MVAFQFARNIRFGRQLVTRLPLCVAVFASALLASGQSPAYAANVSVVVGSAYGYRSFNINLKGPQPDIGPTPTVALASNASNSPQTASASMGLIEYFPAVLFTSDQVDVSTSGSLGSSGSVTTSATIRNINKATTQPTKTGTEILTADTLASTCTATTTGVTRSVSVTNGSVQTDSGLDQNDNGNYNDLGDHPPVSVAVPSQPSPNTTYEGHIHLNNTTTDNWRLVFNEQLTNPDGSATVNAVHEYFLGPTLTGEVILGRADCGVHGPVASPDTYKVWTIFGLTVPAPGVLANDANPNGGALTAALATPPSHGTVTLNADGSFTYSPAFLYLGPDAFTYTVTDSTGLSDTGVVSINVTLPLL